jgi:hypothetical protein
MTVTVHKELLDLLKKPENIKITLEIEQQAQFIRGEIVKTFGTNIKKILQSKLESENLERTWLAIIVFWNSDNSVNVEIRTLKNHSNYSMVGQVAHPKSNGGSFGWLAPQLSNLKTQDVKELASVMNDKGCNPVNGRWLGWKYLRDGKNGILTTDIDDICACFEDNSIEDHPLAEKFANELWDMFIEYRGNIETLESFKQAVSKN